MPLYRIEGVGKESGRKRKPIEIQAKDEKNARATARRKHEIEPKHIQLISVKHYETQVAGGSFVNKDGSSRQKIIHECGPGEKLRLEHEQGNRHDKHATKILRTNGQQVGYVPKETAGEIYDSFFKDSECRLIGIVRNTQPYENDPTRLHLNILILVVLEQTTPAEIKCYLEENQVNCPADIIESLVPYVSLPAIKQNQVESDRPHFIVTTTSKKRPRKSGCFGVIILTMAISLLTFMMI